MRVKELNMDENEFEEVLAEIYEDVHICGFDYSAGQALRAIDPIAFRSVMNEYIDRKFQCGACNNIFDSRVEAEACCREDEN